MMPFNPFSGLTSKIFGALAPLLAIGLAAQTVRIEGFWFVKGYRQQVATLRIDLTKVRDLRAQERANHLQTKANIRHAQFQAALFEQARLTRVATRQQEIADDVVQDYARRLADLRARAERLRGAGGQARAGAAGAPGCQPVPGLPAAPGGAAQAPDDCGLSLARSDQFARPDQFERDIVASEQALQLDALIGFVERQAAVDPNR